VAQRVPYERFQRLLDHCVRRRAPVSQQGAAKSLADRDPCIAGLFAHNRNSRHYRAQPRGTARRSRIGGSAPQFTHRVSEVASSAERNSVTERPAMAMRLAARSWPLAVTDAVCPATSCTRSLGVRPRYQVGAVRLGLDQLGVHDRGRHRCCEPRRVCTSSSSGIPHRRRDSPGTERFVSPLPGSQRRLSSLDYLGVRTRRFFSSVWE
jgi:hypothetical protein